MVGNFQKKHLVTKKWNAEKRSLTIGNFQRKAVLAGFFSKKVFDFNCNLVYDDKCPISLETLATVGTLFH